MHDGPVGRDLQPLAGDGFPEWDAASPLLVDMERIPQLLTFDDGPLQSFRISQDDHTGVESHDQCHWDVERRHRRSTARQITGDLYHVVVCPQGQTVGVNVEIQ